MTAISLEEVITRLYRAILARGVSEAEIADRLQKVDPTEDSTGFILKLVDELVTSEEFSDRYGNNRSFEMVTNADVFYAFKFLLGRLPEHKAIYEGKVKKPNTYSLIEEIVASDEFKSNKILKNIISIRRKPRGFEELEKNSLRNKSNVLIISGCQGRMIADLMQSGGGFGIVENIYLSNSQLDEFVSSDGKDYEGLLSWADVVYTQKPKIHELLRRNESIKHKSKLIPLIEYAGLQPDLCSLTDVRNGTAIIGPMGEYQSLILAAAFFAGLDVDSAVNAFNSDTYARFGYPQSIELSKSRFLSQESSTGYPLQKMFENWDRSGKWMRTNNHPKKFVITDLVRFALEREGIKPMPDFDEFVIDDLAGNADWPQYGSNESNTPGKHSSDLYFKRPKAFTPTANAAEFLALKEYAQMFYRSMEGYSMEIAWCYQLGTKVELADHVEFLRGEFESGKYRK